jgi:hypothetical protein
MKPHIPAPSSRTRHGRISIAAILLLSLHGLPATNTVQVILERQPEDPARPPFTFQKIPPPSATDTASRAAFHLLGGEPDDNSAPLEALHDGRLPTGPDDPAANFFFAAGTDGGLLLLDFGRPAPLSYISTYSRHPGSRAPQVYTLHAARGDEPGFQLPTNAPNDRPAPPPPGWTTIAVVDTRTAPGQPGGQHGVLITNSTGPLGPFRYLLFDIRATEHDDPFGNTFFSEIDVVSTDPDFVPTPPARTPGPEPFTVQTPDGRFAFTLDLSQAPELEPWTRERLVPVILEWYPKLAELFGVEGVDPPDHVHLILRPGRGVAATSGTRITANSRWIERERDGEAVGAIVHELVHVLQQYGRRPRGTPPPPGWLVEGIADYLRWFIYEPHSHGADLTWLRRQQNPNLRHDAGYRLSANFLDWVTRRHDPELVRHLNAALRLGRYNDSFWKTRTGHTLDELAEAWRRETEQALARP